MYENYDVYPYVNSRLNDSNIISLNTGISKMINFLVRINRLYMDFFHDFLLIIKKRINAKNVNIVLKNSLKKKEKKKVFKKKTKVGSFLMLYL